jgi:alpha-1,3-rhamnosyltransferase
MIATELLKDRGDKPVESNEVFVVVPSHNHARFIAATLRSIIAQTLAPVRLLVIDDGSTDGSPRIIEECLQDCPFPSELIVRENLGLSATLNEAFEQSSSEYFAYLGSDDLWLPDFLQARVALLNSRSDVVLAYGHAYIVDENNKVIDSTADWATYTDGNVRDMLLHTTAPMSPTVVYRRAALERERWNEASKLEDYDLYLRLSAKGPFGFDPGVLSAWRRHESNVSRDQELMLREQLSALREAALRFNFSSEQIENLQTMTRFNRAEDFLRIGQKSQALQLMLHNLRGAHSPRTTAKMLLRLLTPNSFMRGRKRFRERRAHERYGSIDV